jgi:hypothetical protein
MELRRASAGGPTALDAFLQTHVLTPALAAGVRELFVSFLKTDQFGNAEVAASVLAVLWLRLGNFHEVLRNRLHERVPEGREEVLGDALSADVCSPRLAVHSPGPS